MAEAQEHRRVSVTRVPVWVSAVRRVHDSGPVDCRSTCTCSHLRREHSSSATSRSQELRDQEPPPSARSGGQVAPPVFSGRRVSARAVQVCQHHGHDGLRPGPQLQQVRGAGLGAHPSLTWGRGLRGVMHLAWWESDPQAGVSYAAEGHLKGSRISNKARWQPLCELKCMNPWASPACGSKNTRR